ncbi:MAG: VWA domain-containing protein [Bacteroidetes bacterium]|nr:VWA domain-containing protein [Bacteroidota bacterium]
MLKNLMFKKFARNAVLVVFAFAILKCGVNDKKKISNKNNYESSSSLKKTKPSLLKTLLTGFLTFSQMANGDKVINKAKKVTSIFDRPFDYDEINLHNDILREKYDHESLEEFGDKINLRKLLQQGTPSPTVDCNLPINLMFGVDASGSVGSSNFNITKNWLKKIVHKLDLDPQLSQTKIGLIEFHNLTNYYLPLGYHNESYVNSIIDNDLEYQINGYTNTPLLLNDTIDVFDNEPQSNHTKNILILITDGIPCMPDNCPYFICEDPDHKIGYIMPDYIDYGLKLKQENIRPIIIEIGPKEQFSFINCLVEKPARGNDIISVKQYSVSNFDSITGELVDDICRTPTFSPTTDPTVSPTTDPTKSPTKDPTISPTKNPTKSPTLNPTKSPTTDPSKSPTTDPTTEPTSDPTKSPTFDPTKSPTTDPSKSPTTDPTIEPTTNPTKSPTKNPTISPTKNPTLSPSKDPTISPSKNPSVVPTKNPTISPTTDPTTNPTYMPTTNCELKKNTIFLFDESGSIGSVNFQTILDWFRTVLLKQPFHLSRIGIIEFSTNAVESLPLDYYNRSYLNYFVQNQIIYNGGITNTPAAIELAASIFNQTDTASDENNQIILVTDGVPCVSCGEPGCCTVSICEYSDFLYTNNIRSIGVLVGTNANSNYINCLFLKEGDKILTNFNELDTIIDDLFSIQCETLPPSPAPSTAPTFSPSKSPASAPTFSPTKSPTTAPTNPPSAHPTTSPTTTPTNDPTTEPTTDPTHKPTTGPSFAPTKHPTTNPTNNPTISPTNDPTNDPTTDPTPSPTPSPTMLCNIAMNIMIGIDQSAEQSDFDNIKEFAKKVVRNINTNTMEIGFSTYCDSANTNLEIGHYNKEYLEDFIEDNILKCNDTQRNIPQLLTNNLDINFKDIKNQANLLLLLNGGFAYLINRTVPLNLDNFSSPFREASIRTVSVGFGSDNYYSPFQNFYDPHHLQVENDLDIIANDLVPRLCETFNPTTSPTTSPTKNPTKSPTTDPTKSPTDNPSKIPTKYPTISPTKNPTDNPSKIPTKHPTIPPTKNPTISPTKNPTYNPTKSPTNDPTDSPTTSPTSSPSPAPTNSPNVLHCDPDIIVGIDVSGTICQDSFASSLKIGQYIANYFETDSTKFGAYSIGNAINQVLPFAYHPTRQYIKNVISNVTYENEFTDIKSFITIASTELGQNNPAGNNMVIIISDGHPCPNENDCPQDLCITEVYDTINNNRVRPFLIQVGPLEQYSLIDCILKTSTDKVKILPSYSDAYLDQIAQDIVDKFCETVAPSPSPSAYPTANGTIITQPTPSPVLDNEAEAAFLNQIAEKEGISAPFVVEELDNKKVVIEKIYTPHPTKPKPSMHKNIETLNTANELSSSEDNIGSAIERPIYITALSVLAGIILLLLLTFLCLRRKSKKKNRNFSFGKSENFETELANFDEESEGGIYINE